MHSDALTRAAKIKLMIFDVDGVDIGTGNHDLLYGAIGELENTVDQFFLGPVEDPL